LRFYLKTIMAKKNKFVNGKYINPYTDFGFKKIFGTEANKDVLQHFLQNLLQLQGQINHLSYLNTERFGRSESDRKAVFDIYCETDSGEKFIVEMQKAKQKFFKDRSVYYASFPIQEQANRGEDWDFELKAIYTVGILDFIFDENKHETDKYYYHVQLSDTDTREVFYDKLTFVYLEMPKFTKTEDELETSFDKWLYALKNLSKLQDRPQALQDRVFQKLFNIAEFAKLSLQEQRAYDESLKDYWDYQNTINTAVEEAVEKVVTEMNEKLAEKNETITQQTETITQQTETITQQTETITQQTETITQQTEKLAEKDEALKRALARIAELEKGKK